MCAGCLVSTRCWRFLNLPNSAFTVTEKELRDRYPDQFAALKPNTRAILIGDTLHSAPTEGEIMNLVIAQYWQNHLRVILLGVYAPATLAITECLTDRLITEQLGPYRFHTPRPRGKNDVQPILINQIMTTITQGHSRTKGKATRDMREVANKKVLGWQRWQVVNGRYECLKTSQNSRPQDD